MRSEDVGYLVQKIQKQKSEEQTVELKEANKGFPHKIYDTLSSFANQDDGGIIIFGIKDRPSYKVVGVYDVEDVQKKIMESCNQMEPKVRCVISIGEVDGKYVVVAEIPGVAYSERPVFYAGAGRLRGSYVRVGDADERMTEAEIYAYEAFRKRIKDDLRLVGNSELKYINKNRLEQYIRAIKENRRHLAENVSDDELLEFMGIVKDDCFTLAGALTFSLYPQIYLPQLCITAVSIAGNEKGGIGERGERFIDNQRITGAVPEMLEDAVAFVRRNSRTMTVIKENGNRADEPEYPLIAVREAILNALVHRDYSIQSENIPITIEMYRNRLEIRNSGGLYGGVTVADLGVKRTESRNAVLENMLELLHITENRYSGIPTIRAEMKKAHLPEPVFLSQKGDFVVIFYNALYDKPITDESQAMLKEAAFTEANEGNRLKKAVVNDDLCAVCDYCRSERSRAEIVTFVGRSPAYVNKKIMNPLLKEGRLRMTIPDKPNSRLQKYITVI